MHVDERTMIGQNNVDRSVAFLHCVSRLPATFRMIDFGVPPPYLSPVTNSIRLPDHPSIINGRTDAPQLHQSYKGLPRRKEYFSSEDTEWLGTNRMGAVSVWPIICFALVNGDWESCVRRGGRK